MGIVAVGYVVAEAAVGVHGVDGAALPGRKSAEGVVEVAGVLFGYPLAVLIGLLEIGSHDGAD